MSGGDVVWHTCAGCAVAASYPVELVGSRVACPSCRAVLTLPAPAGPGAAGYAGLTPTRRRRGIKWNGRAAWWGFTNMQEWSTSTFTIKKFAGYRDKAADTLVDELRKMGDGVKLFRPAYRERAAGGRCVRVEASIDGTYDVVADVEVGARYDALTITVRRYWENPKNSTVRALMVVLGLCVFPGPMLFFGGLSLLEDAYPDQAEIPLVALPLAGLGLAVAAGFGVRAACLFVRDLLRANRFAAADQNSTAFRHRIDQAIQAVLSGHGEHDGLGVPDYLVQRS